jgi:hypothetical protein
MTDSYVVVPPDSTGKKLAARQHTLSATVVQVPLHHIASGDNAANVLNVDSRGAAQVRFTEGQPIVSSYGALKTEAERQLGVYDATLDSYDDLMSIVTIGTGSSTYDPVKSSTVLAVGTASGDAVKRTTNRYHYYQMGTSNLMRIAVACGDVGKVGNKRRWGCFDDNDGIFFELNGTEFRAVIRTSTPGVVVESPIPRAAWTDKLDGTGLSGFTLDVTKINNYWADYTFSGGGRVRFGVYEPNGSRLIAYTVQTGNAYTYPSIRSGTLPIRTENVNTASTGSGSELREVTMSLSTEGTPDDYTFWRSADMEVYGVTPVTDTHLISLRSIATINSKHNPVQCYPETLSVVTTGGAVAISLWQKTALTSPSWVIGNGDSSIEGSTAGTLNTAGARKMLTFFVDGTKDIDLTPYFETNDEGIHLLADGTAELWSITATKLNGTTVTVGVNLAYRELW